MGILNLPNEKQVTFNEPTTGLVLAQTYATGQPIVGFFKDNAVFDLSTQVQQDDTITLISAQSKQGTDILWHSGAHLLAHAVHRLFPEALPTIGPTIEQGFYYDFAFRPFTPEDIDAIEQEMHKIVKENIPIVRKTITKQEALQLFSKNPYKIELIEEYADTQLTVYEQGDFIDLCRGTHVASTGILKACGILKTSGAYWRGDAKNTQLQRIYGICFIDKKELKAYKANLELAKKRDHRVLGKQHDLLMFHEYAPGAPFFLANGTIIYNELIEFIRHEYKQRGYQEVITPQLYNKKLWETSGHWQHYKDDMFIINVEGEEHSLKPMNCPSHCLIYNRTTHSYKDLPLRIADFCALHRNELSGTLSGLTRVRKFAQDDAHIFCTLDQVEQEVLNVLEFIKYVWEDVFTFHLTYYLSTKPEEALGTQDIWDKAETMLKNALQKAGITYGIKEGDGAFYGPKIDIDLQDAMGRKWQCPTCQLDFNLPQRFETMYEGEDGKKHYAVMIHRAVLGSLERFIAILIEHYAGKFPLWISPQQVRILPIAQTHVAYAQALCARMQEHNIRVSVDEAALTINKKVRNAQLDQVNYILVVGQQEVDQHTVNVRTRDNVVHGQQNVDDFIAKIIQEIKDKK